MESEFNIIFKKISTDEIHEECIQRSSYIFPQNFIYTYKHNISMREVYLFTTLKYFTTVTYTKSVLKIVHPINFILID